MSELFLKMLWRTKVPVIEFLKNYCLLFKQNGVNRVVFVLHVQLPDFKVPS